MVLLFVLILFWLVIFGGGLFVLVCLSKMLYDAAVSAYFSFTSYARREVEKVDSAPYPPYDPSNANHNPSGYRHGDPERFKK